MTVLARQAAAPARLRLRADAGELRLWAGVALLLAALALIRPVNHDESQYVAAAVLSAQGLLPFRDYAYLQTPLQPLLFAPVASAAGAWAWPALRLLGALLGAAALFGLHRACRAAGADARATAVATALFGLTDIFLFCAGVARNDALPLALFCGALPFVVRAESGRATDRTAFLAGLLLAAAAAAKVSYAVPAAAYGLYALVRARHRPTAVALGALLPSLLVGGTWWLSPEGFAFGAIDFPARGPDEFYAGRAWKMSGAGKLVDTLKFGALGASLPVAAFLLLRARGHRPGALTVLLLAGLAAALMPFPTWRQYLAPPLPPLFVLAALRFTETPPDRRWRVALAVFAFAGVIHSGLDLIKGMPFPTAMRQGALIGETAARTGIVGPVATLTPQFLPSARLPILPESAAGPFYFRSGTLLDEAAERRLRLVSHARPRLDGAAAVLVGGERRSISGHDEVDEQLVRIVEARGWRATPVPGTTFRLFTPPGGASPASPDNSP